MAFEVKEKRVRKKYPRGTTVIVCFIITEATEEEEEDVDEYNYTT